MQLILISFVMVKSSYDISLHLVLIHKQHKTPLQNNSNRLSDFPLFDSRTAEDHFTLGKPCLLLFVKQLSLSVVSQTQP